MQRNPKKQLTIVIPEADEALLRKMAFNKYNGKKGAISLVISEAIRKLYVECSKG